MPIQTVPGSELRYHLICFDKDGRERGDDPGAPGGRLSEVVHAAATSAAEPVTDVFLMSHGWQGDVPAAIRQYDRWTAAMAGCAADLERARRLRPGFRPLLVGLHWPSQPFGDESMPSGVSFDAGEAGAAMVAAADGIADSERAMAALETIFTAAAEDLDPERLPPEVAEAYRILAEEAGLAGGGPEAEPGDDAEPFDPQEAYRQAQAEEGDDFSFGVGSAILNGMLAPLRGMSFWKMKQRARSFGESGGATFLRQLMAATGPEVRFHLMGHSFGCIVMSATAAGKGGDEPLPRPVHSMLLAQGALSVWSYCADIPFAQGTPGYFRALLGGKVAGPLLTTRSEHDTAVGKLYPAAAGVAGQVQFVTTGEPPKYGALGTYGVRGPGVDQVDLPLGGADADYGFVPGRVYNFEASDVIRKGGGAAGAHNDIAHPEVGHAFWSAVLTEIQ